MLVTCFGFSLDLTVVFVGFCLCLGLLLLRLAFDGLSCCFVVLLFGLLFVICLVGLGLGGAALTRLGFVLMVSFGFIVCCICSVWLDGTLIRLVWV